MIYSSFTIEQNSILPPPFTPLSSSTITPLQCLDEDVSISIPEDLLRATFQFLCHRPEVMRKITLTSKKVKSLVKEEIRQFIFMGGQADLYLNRFTKNLSFIAEEKELIKFTTDHLENFSDCFWRFSGQLQSLKAKNWNCGFSPLTSQLTNLTSLQLRSISSNYLPYLSYSASLAELKIEEIERDDEHFLYNLGNFPNLTALSLRNPHDKLQMLKDLGCLTNLRVLSLKRFFLPYSERIKFITNLTRLETLKLSKLCFSDDYSGLDLPDQGSISLFNTLTRLTKLKLCLDQIMSRRCVTFLFAEPEGLRSLDLSHSIALNVKSIQLLTSLTHLTYLNLSACGGVSEDALTTLQSMTTLRELRVRELPDISKAVLIGLQEKNQNLVISHEAFDPNSISNHHQL